MSPGDALLLFLGACTVVALVAGTMGWDPSHICLYRSRSNRFRAMPPERRLRAMRRDHRYGDLVRGLVWPLFIVVMAFGFPLALPLYLAGVAIQAVARWVLNPRWEPVLALSLVAGVLWLLSRCGN